MWKEKKKVETRKGKSERDKEKTKKNKKRIRGGKENRDRLRQKRISTILFTIRYETSEAIK